MGILLWRTAITSIKHHRAVISALHVLVERGASGGSYHWVVLFINPCHQTLPSTLVNTSYFGGLNSLLSGRRRNEGGNKKHYDISKLEAAEKKVQGSIHKPRYWG